MGRLYSPLECYIIYFICTYYGLNGKRSYNAGATGDVGLILVVKTPWRRKWQPSPIFFPGESHGQRSVVGCSA